MFNTLGGKVKTLHEGELAAEIYGVTWDGRDDANSPVTTGVCVYRLRADDHLESKKMLLVKLATLLINEASFINVSSLKWSGAVAFRFRGRYRGYNTVCPECTIFE